MSKTLHLFIPMRFLLLLLYVLQSTLATKLSSSSQSFSHNDECFALFQFKNKMSTNKSVSSDPLAYPKVASWKINSSKGGTDCCFWDGVECSNKTSGHVIGLDLSSSFLYGTINSASSLFDLIHLRSLNLADNNFNFSQISSEIGRFSRMKKLDLSGSSFAGTLPASVSNLTQLEFLNLRDNSLRGRIPNLASLSKLSYLSLFSNDFDGRNISDWFGKLPKLSVLDLRLNNLSCEIPSSIGNLTQLEYLYLNYNNMFGQIPSSLMNLTNLIDLILGFNDFTGSIPNLESLSNLEDLFLSLNKFDKWTLPDWLGKLNKLTRLDLSGVNLYGGISLSVFNLTEVQTLSLSSNQLEGPIPPFPSSLTKLTELSLMENQLTGPIPSSLSNLENVEAVVLNDNNISDTVEVDLFLGLKKLTVLTLGGNQITLSVIKNHTNSTPPKIVMLNLGSCNLRTFPHFLRFQDQLQELHLDDNNISGLIPEWMGNVSKQTLQTLSLSKNSLTGFEKNWSVVPWVGLRILDLSHNMLHGSIPLPPPTTINFLLSNNKLTSHIPSSICDIRSLQLLDLSFNNISGSIPLCFDKLYNSLLVLNLRGNALQGTIPNTFTNGSKLLMINLSENQLEGRLPRSLVNCASLQILDLGYNHIDDMYPFWLGALAELQVIILRSNKLHGTIRIAGTSNPSFPKVRIIDLSNNSISGDFPHEYFHGWLAMKQTKSDATYMQANIGFFVANYFWFGNYSYSMKMVNKGVSREYEKIINIFIAVDFSSNKFRGIIPDSIKELSGLQLLNLSNNEFSGVIPSSMGSLTQLESLDLSSNTLEGRMPQELVQLNFLEVLNVSYNNLTGPIPQGKQFKTFMNNSYLGNSALCGDPLAKKCGKPDVSKPPTVSFEQDIESDFPSGVDWVVILSGLGSGLVIGLLFGNHLTTRFCNWCLERFKKW